MTFQARLGITRRVMAGIGGNLKSGTAKTWRAGSRKSADQVIILPLKKLFFNFLWKIHDSQYFLFHFIMTLIFVFPNGSRDLIFVNFGPEKMFEIEKGLLTAISLFDAGSVDMLICGQIYVMDFREMTQRRKNGSGRIRRIRREVDEEKDTTKGGIRCIGVAGIKKASI